MGHTDFQYLCKIIFYTHVSYKKSFAILMINFTHLLHRRPKYFIFRGYLLDNLFVFNIWAYFFIKLSRIFPRFILYAIYAIVKNHNFFTLVFTTSMEQKIMRKLIACSAALIRHSEDEECKKIAGYYLYGIID